MMNDFATPHLISSHPDRTAYRIESFVLSLLPLLHFRQPRNRWQFFYCCFIIISLVDLIDDWRDDSLLFSNFIFHAGIYSNSFGGRNKNIIWKALRRTIGGCAHIIASILMNWWCGIFRWWESISANETKKGAASTTPQWTARRCLGTSTLHGEAATYLPHDLQLQIWPSGILLF